MKEPTKIKVEMVNTPTSTVMVDGKKLYNPIQGQDTIIQAEYLLCYDIHSYFCN